MNKFIKILLITFFISTLSKGYSQTININYQFYFNISLTMPVVNEANLTINGNKSLFIFGQDKKDSLINNSGSSGLSTSLSINKFDSIGSVYFKDTKSGLLIFREYLPPFVTVNDSLFDIDWNITTDTKLILGIKCIKATGMFSGRKYIAWFAPSLEYNTGPWKLWNLPGIILEAYEEDKRAYFIANKISVIEDNYEIQAPEFEDAVTHQIYKSKIQKLYKTLDTFDKDYDPNLPKKFSYQIEIKTEILEKSLLEDSNP